MSQVKNLPKVCPICKINKIYHPWVYTCGDPHCRKALKEKKRRFNVRKIEVLR